MASGYVRVLDPVGKPREERAEMAARLATVSGKVLGLLSNGWRSFDAMTERFSDLALEKFEAREVICRKSPNAASGAPKETLDELASVSDAAIVGVGH